jgi:flagellar basal body rod protein FlgG
MDAGRGSYLCGLVLGAAIGVAGTHLVLGGRASTGRLPDLKIEAGLTAVNLSDAEALPSESRTSLAPQPSTVHAIATSPAEVEPTEATSVEPPRPLPTVENAEPLPAEQPREDAELRAFIRDELQTLAASEHDVWYETLRGLSREDATEILRIWKLTRRVESGPISPELKQFAALPIEKPVPTPSPAAPKPHPHESAEIRTHQDEVRRLCQLNLANVSTPGYRSRELMKFEQTGAAGSDGPTTARSNLLIDVSQGKIRHTQRVLDCAIKGSGFFQVKRGNETLLTRCGRFVLDDEGRIALPRSHGPPCPLEPAIAVPKDCEQLQIQLTGEITAVVKGATQHVGAIPMFCVFNSSALEPAGDNLFRITEDSGPARATAPAEPEAIIQGSVEESNVDAAMERCKLDELSNSPL